MGSTVVFPYLTEMTLGGFCCFSYARVCTQSRHTHAGMWKQDKLRCHQEHHPLPLRQSAPGLDLINSAGLTSQPGPRDPRGVLGIQAQALMLARQALH